MNTSTTPTCTIKTVPAGASFLLTLDIKIPQSLLKKDHAAFSYEREFAGLSTRGLPLSVKRSSKPAMIGGIPILAEKPKGWHRLPLFADAGLLVLVPNPRLAFCGTRAPDDRGPWPALCIHNEDLSPIVQIDNESLVPLPNDVVIDELSPNVATLIMRHAPHLKIILLAGATYVRVSSSLRLDRTAWIKLGRYVFTGNSSAPFADTVRMKNPRARSTQPSRFQFSVENGFSLPGHTLDEVKAKWGISDAVPDGYDGQNLWFNEWRVEQGSKLAKLYPVAANLEGRILEIPKSFWANYFPISQALKAGVIPPTGVLNVDARLETIWIPEDQVQIQKLKYPLHFKNDPHYCEDILLCSKHLMTKFLIPARDAVRTYVITGDIKSWTVRTQDCTKSCPEDPSGKFYLLTDLQKLEQRDFKKERARKKKLAARYGAALPRGYAKLTDEEIAHYYQLQSEIQQAELIPVEKHPLLPCGYRNYAFLDWIKTQAPHLIKTCPITNQDFLSRSASFEDLADISGFWDAIEAAIGVGEWLRRLVISPKVQTAALISSL